MEEKIKPQFMSQGLTQKGPNITARLHNFKHIFRTETIREMQTEKRLSNNQSSRVLNITAILYRQYFYQTIVKLQEIGIIKQADKIICTTVR